MKRCYKCKENKPEDLFYKNKSKKDGLCSLCKTCHQIYDKTRDKKRRYGITVKQYNKMFEKQNGVCAICHKCETRKHQSGTLRRLSIDHDHKTGKVRGLLCDKCNRLLGMANDNRVILANALYYLD